MNQHLQSHIPAASGRPGDGYRIRETALRRFFRNKPALFGAFIVTLVVFAALAAPLISPQHPQEQNYEETLAPPSLGHPLGADRLGRDTLSRLIHAARTSLTVGILTQVVVLAIGVPVGLLAGLASSRADNLLMRGVDLVYAFPDLLLIILLRAVLGGGVLTVTLAIGIASWPTIARLVRGQVLSLREREFVMAATSMGAGPGHIMLRHLLPNAAGPVIVASVFLIPRAIFAEAALSYIGIGITPPTPSWGSMVQEAYGVIFVAYEQVLFPSIAIALVIMGFTLLGDGLHDLLRPRAKNR